MRSTKASAAIERLNKRSGLHYSMTLANNGMFCLALRNDEGEAQRLSEPMQMEDFVAFVNAYGPQMSKKVSKLDVEFSKQLNRNNPANKK